MAFAWSLREAGLPVGLSRIVGYVQALSAVDPSRRDEFYWAARLTLCSSRREFETFDRLFEAFWRPPVEAAIGGTSEDGQEALPPAEPHPNVRLESGVLSAGDDSATGDSEEESSVGLQYSPEEALRLKDFSEYDEDDLRAARRVTAAIRLSPPLRRSHRTMRSRRGRLDLRATLRRSARSGGDAMRWQFRAQRRRPRRVVFLCDVSGSMSQYSRALLLFLHAAVRSRRNVEAFCFGTRLTRVTRELSPSAVERAIAGAAARVTDWSGGTRIGQSLRSFCDLWGQRGFARGAIVVIMSDGWDTGEPELLAAQMGRLRRLCHRLIWVNPLSASPGYQPLAQGMAAALPATDEFLPAHNLRSLDALADVIKGALQPRGHLRGTAGAGVARHGRD